MGRHSEEQREFLFLYLDRSLMESFIAQHDRMHITGQSRRNAQTTKTELGAGLGAGLGPFKLVGPKAGRKWATSHSESQTGTPVPASEFIRFYNNLRRADKVQDLFALDLAIWEQLQPGEFVEVRAKVTLPFFSHLVKQATEAKQAMVISKQMGKPIPQHIRTTVAAIEAMVNTIDRVPIIARVAGSPKFRFVARLHRLYMPSDETSLEDAECFVFGKIERKLKRGERMPTTDLFPATLGKASSQEARRLTDSVAGFRREAEERLAGAQVPEDPVFVGYPAAQLAPLAIYR